MALAVALKFGIRIDLIIRPLDFAPMDRILSEIRASAGNIIINANKGAVAIREILSKNKIVSIMLDQNASYRDGVYVPFFGRTACTNKGVALFAMRYGATVLPIFNIRLADGRYKIIFEKPISLVHKSGNITIDIINNTILYNSIIEKYVRIAPESWFWVHRRWWLRTIPEEVKRKYKKLIDLSL